MEHPMRWLSLVCLFLASVARGEIIIDDFDDPASAASPAMLNDFVGPQHNVGPLGATRRIRFAAIGAHPDATMTIADSILRVEFDAMNPRPGSRIQPQAA